MSRFAIRRFVGTGWLVCVGLVCVAAPVPAQEVSLNWKLRPGEVFYLLTDTEARSDTTLKDQTVSQRMRVVMLYRYQVLEASPNGYVLEHTVEDVATDNRDLLGSIFAQMRGIKLKVHMDRSFKITKLEGHQELLKKIGADDPVAGKVLQEMVSEASLREQIQGEFNFLPDKPVKPGDQWERQFTIPAGPLGTFNLRQKLTYDGTETVEGKVLDRIRSTATATYTLPKAAGDLPVKVSKGEILEQDWKGTLWFDREAGRLARSELNSSYRLRVVLVLAAGKPADAEPTSTMEIKQETKYRSHVSSERPSMPKLEAK
jgi:hypothetical protein